MIKNWIYKTFNIIKHKKTNIEPTNTSQELFREAFQTSDYERIVKTILIIILLCTSWICFWFLYDLFTGNL